MGYIPDSTPEGRISSFRNTVSAIASVLLRNQSMGNTVLSHNNPYKRILNLTMFGSRRSNLDESENNDSDYKNKDGTSFQDINDATTGKTYFRNQYCSTKTSFQVLSYISDDILYDIPNEIPDIIREGNFSVNSQGKSKNKKLFRESSLFQGFNVYLPIINEVINSKTDITDNFDDQIVFDSFDEADEMDNTDDDLLVPHDIKVLKLEDIYSIKLLEAAARKVTGYLDLLEIQKDLATGEIQEIDLNLKALKKARELTFEKVAKVEQNELLLEKYLSDIRDQIDTIKEYNLDEDPPKDKAGDENSSLLLSESERSNNIQDNIISKVSPVANMPLNSKITNINENDDENISQTIEIECKDTGSKLLDNQGSSLKRYFKKKQQHDQDHRHQRKSYPTLQQYYNSGDNISSLCKAHNDGITCLDFNIPFGTLCSASNMDPVVKVWDLSRKKQITSMSGHLTTINCMQMDQYNTLITGGKDALLKLWDVDRAIKYSNNTDDPCVHTFDAHIDEITSLSFDRENLVSGSQDRTIRQWDLNTGKCIQTIDISFATSRALDHSIEDRRSSSTTLVDTPIIGTIQCFDAALATGTKDGVVRLWDLRSGQVVRTLEGHSNAVTSLHFDSVNLITGSKDSTLRIWDLRTGSLCDIFLYRNPVSGLQFDSHKILAIDNEDTVKIYERRDGTHWACGNATDDNDNPVQCIRYIHGYLVEGRSNGDINTWAV